MPKKSNKHVNITNKKEYRTNQKKATKQGTEKRSLGQGIKLVLQLLILFVLIIILGVIIYFYLNYGETILQLQSEAKHKVSTSTSDTFRSVQTGLVYDAKENIISTLKTEKDIYYLEYDEIPAVVVDAMLVSEDKKFFEHGGVDYLANIRAVVALIKHKGEITQGASTITQQLARNVFLSHKVTYERKIEEIFIAQELEKKYTKTDIMEYYLNEIYFANGFYGIQAAAQGYFDEGISSLSLSQSVFLCAIPNSPNRYNPLTNMENTLERRDRILLQMYEDGRITNSEYDLALKEKITLKQSKADKKNYVETYAYYCAIRALMMNQGFEFRYQFDSEADEAAYDEAYDELYYRYQKELYVKGYRIYTSIDLKKQNLLQETVDDALKGFTKVNKEGVYKMQGAAVCIDNDTGKVVAIVGGRNQDMTGYTLNRGYQSFRQPGSSIKPLIVYTPSFERNYTPDSTVLDKSFEGGPKNAGNSYSGEIMLKRAIELSKNTVAWKMFEELTPRVGLSYLLNMNFAKIKESDYVPAAALGGLTIGVSPVEMAAAYAAIENDGYYREPTCIVRITDAEGNEIVGKEVEIKQIYQTNAARMMTETLMGVIQNGTAKGLGLTNTTSAGKTGTTNDKKDGWFVGYTPYYTTSVWVGYDIPRSVDDLTGATYPGAIWHNYMNQIHTASMKDRFSLYDWRADLEEAKEEDAKSRAEEEADSLEKIMQGDAWEDEATKEEDSDNATIQEDTSDNAPTQEDNSENEDMNQPEVENQDVQDEEEIIEDQTDQNVQDSEGSVSEDTFDEEDVTDQDTQNDDSHNGDNQNGDTENEDNTVANTETP